jgi:HAD superfamily hydrolase (TIGR01509 family)
VTARAAARRVRSAGLVEVEGAAHVTESGAHGPIRAVAFDLMDTVVTDPFREALTAATGLPVAELFARRDPALYPAFERGEVDEAAYWAHYAEAGITADPEVFHRVRRAGLTWRPGMRELLDDLEGVVVRAAATNYPVWIDELADGLLAGRFERVVASCHLGVRKPDPGFYRRLLTTVDLPPDAVLFVDDREANVAGARAAGMAAHRFVDARTLRAWLADHDVDLPHVA